MWDRSLIVVNVLSGAFIVYVLYLVGRPIFDQRPYAERVFGSVVDYDSVVSASEAINVADGWFCSSAIVKLSANAGTAPVNDNTSRHWHETWGGNWQETPVTHPGPRKRDALYDCADEWPPGVYKELRSAIDAPGSFYLRDDVGETLMIYSKPYRLAARVRSGD